MFGPNDELHKFTATLYGYFDESGKAHEQDVVGFSGFVTTSEAWNEMAGGWQSLLRKYELPPLHGNPLRIRRLITSKKPALGAKDRIRLLREFIFEIKRQVEFGISVSVSVEAFKPIPERVRQLLGGDPHYVAFRSVVLRMLTHIGSTPGTTLGFVCDEDEKTTLPCYAWLGQLKRERLEARKHIVSFCVADDEHFPQLQASDLFARFARLEAEREILSREYEGRELFEALIKPELGSRLGIETLVLKADDLKGLAETISQKARKAKIQDKLGL